MEKILVYVCGSEYPEETSEQAFEIAKRFSIKPTNFSVYYVLVGPEVSQKILDKANALGSVLVAR